MLCTCVVWFKYVSYMRYVICMWVFCICTSCVVLTCVMVCLCFVCERVQYMHALMCVMCVLCSVWLVLDTYCKFYVRHVFYTSCVYGLHVMWLNMCFVHVWVLCALQCIPCVFMCIIRIVEFLSHGNQLCRACSIMCLCFSSTLGTRWGHFSQDISERAEGSVTPELMKEPLNLSLEPQLSPSSHTSILTFT